MKTSRFYLGAFLLGLGGLSPFASGAAAPPPEAAGNKAPAAPVLSPRFRLVRERIDDLYRHRNASGPESEQRYDPFRAAGASGAPLPAASAGSATPGGGASAPTPAADLTLLQQAVATLKVSGVVEFGGRQLLAVNSRPYKEGDVIQTQVQGQTVYLRVRQISRTTLTLALNEAEMTLKF